MSDLPDDFGMGVTTGVPVPFFWEQHGATVRVHLIGTMPENGEFTARFTYEVE